MNEYPENESSVLELKREIPAKNQIIKSIVGFCNMHGGKLVVGVDDSRKILGVEEENLDCLMEQLHQSIFESCAPIVIPAIYGRRLYDKIILVIEVSEGMNKPYYIKSQGLNSGTYIRVATQTVKANNEMIQELQWQTRGKHLDEMPVYSATMEAIDEQAFRQFLERRLQQALDQPVDELMRHYHVFTVEHTKKIPTVSGILLFGHAPQETLTESFIICSHFQGTSGREVLATRDCTGTLFQQLKDCVAFIFSRLNRQFSIEGVGPRNEQLEIPEQAIREAVMNAIVHRNYQISGPTKVAIYDDRVEIFSPGNFPGPLKIDRLELGVTYIRNMVITRVFREIGEMEKLGSGFLTIFQTYKDRNLPRPFVVEGTGFVKCVLPRPTPEATPNFESNEEQVISLLHQNRTIRAQDIVTKLSVSRATASRLLERLARKGVIKRVGKGPATYYTKA